MKRILQISAIFLFSLLLTVPALYQAWKERSHPDGIQITHLPLDMFQSPLLRQAELTHALDSLLVQLDSIHVALATGISSSESDSEFSLPSLDDSLPNWPNDSDASPDELLFWENSWQGMRQVRARAQQINRYMSVDSLHPQVAPFGALAAFLETHYNSVQDGKKTELSFVDSLRTQVSQLYNNLHQESSFRLIFHAIFDWTLFNADYLRAWEKRMEKESVTAEAARARVQTSLYHLFGDLGEKGVRGQGSGHWSFYRPGLQYATQPFGSAADDDPLDAIFDFQKQLRSFGAELLVVVVPNKESIYPEEATPRLSAHLSGRVSHGPRLLDSLRAHQVAVVDLFTTFAQARERNPDRTLYLRDDTHWSPQGALTAARAIANSLRSLDPDLDSLEEYVLRDTSVFRTGDILEMSRLPLLGVPFSPEKVTASQVFALERDSTDAVIASRLYKDDMRHARVLLLGDSFCRIYQTDSPRGAGLGALLAAQLGQPLASLVSDGGASTLVRERLARKPALLKGKKWVVWEFVERDIRFGADGWKKIPLH